MKNMFLVFVGGGLGSVMRYVLSHIINKSTPSPFPFGTFVVNVIGCFLIGFIMFYSARFGDRAEQWRFFLATGLCGGFTTFSAFSLESISLLTEQRILIFLTYIIGSVATGIIATYGGLLLAKNI
jgi:CrcB protein